MLRYGLWALCVPLTLTGAWAQAGVIELPILDGAVASSAQLYGTIGFVDVEGQAFCTGTLIAPTVAVSAAHCFVTQDEDTDAIIAQTDPGEVFVVAGDIYAEEVPFERQYDVIDIINHPNYPNPLEGTDLSGIARQDDIAVVLLAEPVEEVDVVRIPSVGEARSAMEDDPVVIITGYGLTDPNSQQAGVLHIAETVLGPQGEFEFVAGAPGRPDSCKGDSGGPAYIPYQDVLHVFGASARAVASSDKLCGDGGIYTFLPAYRSWLASASQGQYIESDPLDESLGVTAPHVRHDDGCSTGGEPHAWLGLIALTLLMVRPRRDDTPFIVEAGLDNPSPGENISAADLT